MTILYVGQTRSAKMIKLLDQHGIRELTQRDVMPPKRKPWALDNGAFEDKLKKIPFFDGVTFSKKLRKTRRDIEEGSLTPPDFVVLPDIVEGGMASLEFSKEWYLGMDGVWAYPDYPWYFVVQDGMTPENIDLSWGKNITGIFVGGSLSWKLQTGAAWVKWSHQVGKKCHIGRATEPKRVMWARRIGADSIDGNGPLWTEKDLMDTIKLLQSPMSPMDFF